MERQKHDCSHTAFDTLSDAVEFASLMSHDINCTGALELFDLEDNDFLPIYWVICPSCGDVAGCSPVVYYRYRARWGTDSAC